MNAMPVIVRELRAEVRGTFNCWLRMWAVVSALVVFLFIMSPLGFCYRRISCAEDLL